jgi:hypothetical protein
VAWRGWLAVVVLFISSGARASAPISSLLYSPYLLSEVVKDHGDWTTLCTLSPEERLGVPEPLRAEVQEARLARPVAPALVLDLKQVIRGLPPPLARMFARHVCSVVLVHESSSSATLALFRNDAERGIIVLDIDKLELTPNEWITFKESTPYALAPQQRILGKLAEPSEDVRATLLEFLIVHELAHIVDSVGRDETLIASFKHVGWPRADELVWARLVHYPERLDRLPLSEHMVVPYFDLIATGPYTSPAAVTRDDEDFGDSVATFVHTVLRGRPWQLELYRDGVLQRRLTACWTEPRCYRKRLLLEMMLERWLRP